MNILARNKLVSCLQDEWLDRQVLLLVVVRFSLAGPRELFVKVLDVDLLVEVDLSFLLELVMLLDLVVESCNLFIQGLICLLSLSISDLNSLISCVFFLFCPCRDSFSFLSILMASSFCSTCLCWFLASSSVLLKVLFSFSSSSLC